MYPSGWFMDCSLQQCREEGVLGIKCFFPRWCFPGDSTFPLLFLWDFCELEVIFATAVCFPKSVLLMVVLDGSWAVLKCHPCISFLFPVAAVFVCLFCKAGVFQPVFQASMQAEAGRTLASTAGGWPAPALSKWVIEGGAVEALARDLYGLEQAAGS